jgi:hypothetical protein
VVREFLVGGERRGDASPGKRVLTPVAQPLRDDGPS